MRAFLLLRLATMAMSQQSLPPVSQYTGSYTEDVDGDGVQLNAFEHEDASIAYDPLSANRRFAGAADLAVLGTLVFAGATRHSISVMVPDCLLPPENNTVRVDLRFWRCPVLSCSLWFKSELNAKDHIEGIHRFREGHGLSFYECLRCHGMEWFASRRFFDQRQNVTQSLWMDMALARRSGQELRNSYIITNSPEFAPLRRFFKAAVDGLQLVFDRSIVTSVQPRSLITQMQDAVADCDDGSSDDGMMLLSMPHDIPEVTFPVVRETRGEDTPVVISRRLTPANRPLQLLEAGRLGASATEHLPSRPAVPDLCIASSSLLSALDPLPLDRLSRHTVEEITLWPAADRHAILAVANRDVRIARQNIAKLLVYVDDHAAHLANCASANDDSLTLMSAELIPRLEGGIRAVLDEAANL